MADDGGWTTVSRGSGKHRGRRRNRGIKEPSNARLRSQATLEDAKVTKVVDEERVQRTISAVERSMLLFDAPCKRTLETIKDAVAPRCVRRIVCFGLGSMVSTPQLSANSRLQLALLLAMARAWGISQPDMLAFDPAFTTTDERILDSFGITTLQTNNEGKYPAAEQGITLFYMPHCDMWLYSNLMWANWSAGSLTRLIIIGNSFEAYADALGRKRSAQSCVHIVQPYATEIPLRASFRLAMSAIGPRKQLR